MESKKTKANKFNKQNPLILMILNYLILIMIYLCHKYPPEILITTHFKMKLLDIITNPKKTWFDHLKMNPFITKYPPNLKKGKTRKNKNVNNNIIN